MATIKDILKNKNQSFRPSFYTQNKEGVRYPSIKRAFLKSLVLTGDQVLSGNIQYEKESWKIILDSPDDILIREDIAFNNWCRCLMSFQAHNNGNYVVIRKDKKFTKEQSPKVSYSKHSLEV